MNNQLSPISWQALLKKSVVWGVWLFLLTMIQTSFFSVLRVFGAVPDLVLPAIIVIAVYDRERMGTIAGIMGGFLVDALGGFGFSLSPISYMICGVTVALLAYTVLRRDFASWLVGLLMSLVISGIFSVIATFVSHENEAFGFSEIFSKLLVPQFFASLLLALPIYFLTKAIWSRFFDNREMEG